MVASSTELQLALDLIGVFVFALSGALVGVRKQLDLLGVAVLAWVAGLGGGMIRDVFLGDLPPVGISDWRLLTAAMTAGLIVFALHGRLMEVRERGRGSRVRFGLITRLVRVLDAAGLAVFSVGGPSKRSRSVPHPSRRWSSAPSALSVAACCATFSSEKCPRCYVASCMPCPR